MTRLFEITRHTLLAGAIRSTNALQLRRQDVVHFEALCNVLRQHGCSFSERVEVEDGTVQFYIVPDQASDYLAILESTRLMEARRTRSPHAKLFGHDLIDLMPDAPPFWLFTLSSADVCNHNQEETPRA